MGLGQEAGHPRPSSAAAPGVALGPGRPGPQVATSPARPPGGRGRRTSLRRRGQLQGPGPPLLREGLPPFPGPLGLLHTADLRGLLVSKQSIHLSPENRAAPPVLREGRQPRGSCTLAQRPLRGGRGQGSAGPWRTHVCLSLSREAGKGGQEWCSGNVRQRPLDSTWGSLPYPCPGSAGRRWAGPEPHAVPAGAQPC